MTLPITCIIWKKNQVQMMNFNNTFSPNSTNSTDVGRKTRWLQKNKWTLLTGLHRAMALIPLKICEFKHSGTLQHRLYQIKVPRLCSVLCFNLHVCHQMRKLTTDFTRKERIFLNHLGSESVKTCRFREGSRSPPFLKWNELLTHTK